MKIINRILVFLVLIISGKSYAYKSYDISPSLIDITFQRSIYYSGAIPVKIDVFLNVDKTKQVVVHLHGCNGIGYDERKIRDYFIELGMNFVLMDFLMRGDAQTSCPSLKSENTGHPETVNPLRHHARLLELESQIKWLKNNGFERIIVTGHSEGGKTIQQLQEPVEAIISFSMDCKSYEFWRYTDDNKYLFLYSTKDPWITGNGNYPTRTCKRLFGTSNVVEKISNVSSHDPFADSQWKNDIKNFLGID